MKTFNPATSFGPGVAAHYDDLLRGDESAAAAFLAQLAEGGRALEFAIGTGRIALPLTAHGVQVDGIELSPHKVERLRAKPGGDRISVTMGDMSTVTTGHRYKLVYLVFNTIFNLLTADDQIRCFENAARHLMPDGYFVVETALPHAWIAPNQPDYVHAEQVGMDAVVFDVARYNPITQHLEENHVRLTADGISMNPIVCRLITPGEMDLMARIAGLRLVERYANWERSHFDIHSTAHVSIYGLDQPLRVDSAQRRADAHTSLHISPSILAADTANLAAAVRAAAAGGADSLHIDIMDGHYVANYAFSPKTLADLRRVTTLPLHAHLEVSNPNAVLPLFAEADMIIVQEDTVAGGTPDLAATIAAIRQLGCAVGVGVNRDRPVEPLLPILDRVDLLLVMAVEPGFGGQPFDASVLDKVRWLHTQRAALRLHFAIGLDGGINAATIAQSAAAGADFFAVGSAAFTGDISAAVRNLRTAAGAAL